MKTRSIQIHLLPLFHGLLVLALCSVLVDAARVTRRKHFHAHNGSLFSSISADVVEASNGSAALSALGHQQGDVLFGRFRLLNIISTNEDGIRLHPRKKDPKDSSLIEAGIGARPPPYVKFPRTGTRFKPMHYLGSGGFGETWFVSSLVSGQTYALKLLYARNKEGKAVHLMTGTDEAKRYAKDIRAAAKECEYAQKVNRKWKEMGRLAGVTAEHVTKGSPNSPFMKCFEFNQAKETPMYVLLSVAGQMDLMQFLQSQRLKISEGVVQTIMSQIFKGLYVLSKMDPPLIHHDLKASNLMVNRGADGASMNIVFVDYGSMTEYANWNNPRVTTTSLHIAPPEYTIKGVAYIYCPHADMHCESAYDVYSAGNILGQLLTGATPLMHLIEGGTGCSGKRSIFCHPHEALPSPHLYKECLATNPPIEHILNSCNIMAAMKYWMLHGEPRLDTMDDLLEIMKKSPFTLDLTPWAAFAVRDGLLISKFSVQMTKFINKYVRLMLDEDPAKRPTVERLLNDPWIIEGIIASGP